MKKTTDLLNELKNSNNIDNYLKDNEKIIINNSISEHLCKIFEERSLSKTEIIRKSDINEIYAYQILSGKRIPSRDKTICLCIGANFTVEDTNKTLKIGGYAPLYPKSQRDSIIIYGIHNNYTIWQINEDLFNHGLNTF